MDDRTIGFFTRIIALNALGPNLIEPENKPILIYVCNSCDTEHEEEDDAIDCCKPQVRERWKCPVCRKTYSNEDKAADCCPSADKGQPMQCPVCMEPAGYFQIAVDCCLTMHPAITTHGRHMIAKAVENGMPWIDAIKNHSTH